MNAAPYIALYLVPAAISAGLAIYGYQRRQRIGAVPLGMLMAAVSVWCLFHAFSVGSTTLAGTLFWSQLQYIGVVQVGPLWLAFALAYANRWSSVGGGARAALIVPPALALLAVLTNDLHRQWWPTVEADLSKPFGSLLVSHGTFFWLHVVYSYACVLAGIGLVARRVLGEPLFYRRQARLLLIGALVPFVGNVLHLLGVRVRFVDDPTPFLFVISGLLAFYALKRYHLLDLAPIAQRMVFENLPDGVIVLDRRGMVTAINEAAARLLPQRPGERIGQSIATLASGAPFAAELGVLLAGAGRPQSRHMVYNAAGEPRGIEVRLQPIHESTGAWAGSLVLLRDTSERVQAEQERDRHLAELQLLSRVAGAANTIVQTDGLLRLITTEMIRVLPCDRILIAVFQPGQPTPRLMIDQIVDERPAIEGLLIDNESFAIIEQLLRGGQPHSLSIDDSRIAHTRLELRMREFGLRQLLLVPLARQEELLGVMGIGSRSERPLAQNELRLFETLGQLITETIHRTRLYEQAQQANHLKSSFVATVSHELRTPLTSIIGFAEMLKGGVFGPLPADTAEPVDYIVQSSQTLLRLISDILDFSKMEAGHLAFDVYPVDLAQIVHTVVGAMQPQLYQRRLYLRIDLAELPPVRANSARLEQVLTNLVANAVKFTERGGITVRGAMHGAMVRLTVQDTGIGIAPADQQVVFQAFRQVESAATRRFGGTGLGLAISKRLVELMGGSMALESTPGVGSTFHCDLRPAAIGTLQPHEYTHDSLAVPAGAADR